MGCENSTPFDKKQYKAAQKRDPTLAIHNQHTEWTPYKKPTSL